MEQQPVYAFGLRFNLLLDPFDPLLDPVDVSFDLSAKFFEIIFSGCIAHKSAKPQHPGDNER